MLGRIRDAITIANAAVLEAETSFDRETVAFLGLDAAGPSAVRLEQAFQGHVKRLGLRPLKILSCLSEPEHSIRDKNCEFLALAEDIHHLTQDRQDVMFGYLDDRLALMCAKWSVSHCYYAGLRATELVSRRDPVRFAKTEFHPLRSDL